MQDKLKELQESYNRWSQCSACQNLLQHRTQVVYGSGNINSDIMFIGEAPGKEEDREGYPFVGPSGDLLMSVLSDFGLSREDVYITNVVACLPTVVGLKYPKIRQPSNEEIVACRERVYEEIYLVDPKVIVLLGGTAAKLVNLSMTAGRAIEEQPLTIKVPGKYMELEYFALATWHPSYILRQGVRSDGTTRKKSHELEMFRQTVGTALKIIEAAKKLK